MNKRSSRSLVDNTTVSGLGKGLMGILGVSSLLIQGVVMFLFHPIRVVDWTNERWMLFHFVVLFLFLLFNLIKIYKIKIISKNT